MATHTLLVADDSQTVRRIVEMACSGHDFDVVTAADGDGAIAEISGRPPDIVLVDIAMPGPSGYDVAEFVKGRPELAHIPVVLMAGMHEAPDEQRARESGCAEVLVKPLRPQLVVERLRHWLESRPAPAAITVPAAEPVDAIAEHHTTAPFVGFADVGSVLAASTPLVVETFESEQTVVASPVDVAPEPTFAHDTTAVAAFEAESPLVAEAPVAPAVDAAEEYFTRLDQAFRSLGRPLRTGAGPVVPEPQGDAASEPVPTLQELLLRLPEETRTRLTEETRSRLAADAASRQSPGEPTVMEAIVSRVLEQLTRHERMLDEIARRVAERMAAERR
jgi:CheY-like chemotaxis protein